MKGVKAGVHTSSDSEEKYWTGTGMDALQAAMGGFGVSGSSDVQGCALYEDGQ
jgi:hypothetical protein